MGMGVEEVLSLSLHDYQASIHAWNQQGGEDGAGNLSEGEFDEMLAGLDTAGVH